MYKHRFVDPTKRLGTALLGLVACTASLRAEPVATITSPALGSCICGSGAVNVRGTSRNTVPANYLGDTLEFATNPGSGPWTFIGTSNFPTGAAESQLYSWNTVSLPSGTYYLRMTTLGSDGATTAITQVTLNRQPPAGQAFFGIQDGARYYGTLTFNVSKSIACQGAITPEVSYRPLGVGPWQVVPTIDQGPTVSVSLNINTAAEGPYEIQAVATDPCGNSASSVVTFLLDRLAPSVTLSSPLTGEFVRGVVPIIASVNEPLVATWRLDFARANNLLSSLFGWTLLAAGVGPAPSTNLANWNTTGLTAGTYILRLRAEKNSFAQGQPIRSDVYRVVNVGCEGDFNVDGFVSVQDIFDFLTAWFAACV